MMIVIIVAIGSIAFNKWYHIRVNCIVCWCCGAGNPLTVPRIPRLSDPRRGSNKWADQSVRVPRESVICHFPKCEPIAIIWKPLALLSVHPKGPTVKSSVGPGGLRYRRQMSHRRTAVSLVQSSGEEPRCHPHTNASLETYSPFYPAIATNFIRDFSIY